MTRGRHPPPSPRDRSSVILLQGVRASLERLVPAAGATLIISLSNAVAAGNLAAAEAGGIPGEVAHQALAQGFDAVMLYGVAAAFGLWMLSLAMLGSRRRVPAAGADARPRPSRACCRCRDDAGGRS